MSDADRVETLERQILLHEETLSRWPTSLSSSPPSMWLPLLRTHSKELNRSR
jgi:hypothetical protein